MSYVLQQFREQCEKALAEALRESFPNWAQGPPRLTLPSNYEFGELSSSLPHEIARREGLKLHDVAAKIKQEIDIKQRPLIAAIEELSGYLNFRLNYEIAGKMILRKCCAAGGVAHVFIPIFAQHFSLAGQGLPSKNRVLRTFSQGPGPIP